MTILCLSKMYVKCKMIPVLFESRKQKLVFTRKYHLLKKLLKICTEYFIIYINVNLASHVIYLYSSSVIIIKKLLLS
jgi:hypothetical protein